MYISDFTALDNRETKYSELRGNKGTLTTRKIPGTHFY
jgi:hypothetical protein